MNILRHYHTLGAPDHSDVPHLVRYEHWLTENIQLTWKRIEAA